MRTAQRHLKLHDFAKLFPEATGKDLRRLEKDIGKNGIRVPIVVFQGKILDGRNRYQIGLKLDKPIPMEEFVGSAKEALELVASYNLYRRHLKPSQKAMVAASISKRLVDLDGLEPKEAIEVAATVADANPKYVAAARKIMERDPELAKQISDGKDTIGADMERQRVVNGAERVTASHKCPQCGFEF